jgi:hypothetical protein
MQLHNREINRASLEVENVDPRDYPDFCDAYFSYAEYADGTPLTDDELIELGDVAGDTLNEMAYDSLH